MSRRVLSGELGAAGQGSLGGGGSRLPLGSPLGFRADDFRASLDDIDPPPPVVQSASPFRKAVAAAEVRVGERQLDPGGGESPTARRPVSKPPPAVAQQVPTDSPRRFGRLSASTVAASMPVAHHSGPGEEVDAFARPHTRSARGSAPVPDGLEGEGDDAGASRRERTAPATSSPVTRFGRLSLAPASPSNPPAHCGPDHPVHYAQYSDFSLLGAETSLASTPQIGARDDGLNRGATRLGVPSPANEEKVAMAQLGAGTRGWVNASGQEVHLDGRRSGPALQPAAAEREHPSAGSKGGRGNFSGFLSSLFGFPRKGARGEEGRTPTVPERSAPGNGAPEGLDVDEAPGGGGGEEGRAAGSATGSSAARASGLQLLPSPAGVAGELPHSLSQPGSAQGGRSIGGSQRGLMPHTAASSATDGDRRPQQTICRLGGRAQESGRVSVGNGTGAGVWEDLEEGGGEERGMLDVLAPGTARMEAGLQVRSPLLHVDHGALLGGAEKELFALAQLGDLAGIQNAILALSLADKGGAVMTAVDSEGLTLLHWAAREGHQDVVEYLVYEGNADVLRRCRRGLKPAEHAREQWFMKVARLLEAFEHLRDEHARCLQAATRRVAPRAIFGIRHMEACNIQAVVRGKLAMLRQQHVWVYSNMWFNPANYSAREAAWLAVEEKRVRQLKRLARKAKTTVAQRHVDVDEAAAAAGGAGGRPGFRRVASLPSAWGGSELEGRHMLVAMLQAPLRRRLRAGEWELDLPGGDPPQNLVQYSSHMATIMAASVRRRLALIAYNTVRVWLRKTGQASHQAMAALLALNKRPKVGRHKREQEATIEHNVALAAQRGVTTALAKGWTIKSVAPADIEARAAADQTWSRVTSGDSLASSGAGEMKMTFEDVLAAVRAQDRAEKAAAKTQQRAAVCAFLESGTWASLSGAAVGGGDAASGFSQVVHGRIEQADVTPIFKNRAYVFRRQRMGARYKGVVSVAKEQERIKNEFEATKARELAARQQAATTIQRRYRGGLDRETAKREAAARRRQREADMSTIDNKLFSLYDNGTNCLCIHVEWKAEEGIADAAEKWAAVRDNAGGVQGVLVLALRATAVVQAEARRRLARQRQAGKERAAVQLAMREHQAQQRTQHAVTVIQRAVRAVQRRRRQLSKLRGKAVVNIAERKRGQLAELKTQLARHKTSLYAAKGEMDNLKRLVQAAHDERAHSFTDMRALDVQCSQAERARRAAITQRRHQEAGRLRVEFERADTQRKQLRAEAEQLQADCVAAEGQMREVEETTARLRQAIKETELEMAQIQRQLDDGTLDRRFTRAAKRSAARAFPSCTYARMPVQVVPAPREPGGQ